MTCQVRCCLMSSLLALWGKICLLHLTSLWVVLNVSFLCLTIRTLRLLIVAYVLNLLYGTLRVSLCLCCQALCPSNCSRFLCSCHRLTLWLLNLLWSYRLRWCGFCRWYRMLWSGSSSRRSRLLWCWFYRLTTNSH